VLGASLETKEERKQQEETKLITYAPVDKTNKDTKNNAAYIKEYTRMLEQHILPISRMGDIDWYLR
jgi:hypothetical protein